MLDGELKVLKAISDGKEHDAKNAAGKARVDYNSLMSTLSSLEEKGLAEVKRSGKQTATLTKEGKNYSANGTPERRLLRVLDDFPQEADIDKATEKAALNPFEKGIALQWIVKNNWAQMEKKGSKRVLKKKSEKESNTEQALEVLSAGPVGIGSLHAESLKELIARKLASVKAEKSVSIKITKTGKNALNRGASQAIAQLSPEMLSNKSWQDKKFRAYDAGAPAPAIYPAKKNPLRQFADDVRENFLQMGFSEIKGPIVESSFWNFDALFVPQDHPSRELQDTFYVRRPAKAKKIDEKYSKKVGQTHENGWKTNSRGWGYKWNTEKARENVLRTHTTQATCRALVEASKKGTFPVKVFCIDRVFRNEAIDFKHLAEFHQVEGIVIDDSASLNDLVGILKTFFGKLGFPKVRIRPGFFPYTEPSAEVDIFFEEKGEWLELGGAGIFRPEVTLPLGITQNVLAWGLSLERPMMLREKLNDIRTFYRNDLDWIRKEK
ncbi:MAG: phenylalanine--tRNA ligase subunit alpha [Candidatus Micrarchaeia archaeon]